MDENNLNPIQEISHMRVRKPACTLDFSINRVTNSHNELNAAATFYRQTTKIIHRNSCESIQKTAWILNNFENRPQAPGYEVLPSIKARSRARARGGRSDTFTVPF